MWEKNEYFLEKAANCYKPGFWSEKEALIISQKFVLFGFLKHLKSSSSDIHPRYTG